MHNKVQFQMLIQQSIKRTMLFPKVINQWRQPFFPSQSNLILPSSHPFRSSQQINTNISISHIQTSKQDNEDMNVSLNNEWARSCIGMVLCQHYQNKQTYYVYGTGTLIHNSIVLTSAQNVYCRRLHKQYVNIRFVTYLDGNKCSGIYDVEQVHYPKEYMMQQEYENYNSAVLLLLYNDLIDDCGYIGWKAANNLEDEQLFIYGYKFNQMNGLFTLKKIMKQQQNAEYSGNLSIMPNSKQSAVSSEKIRKIINQWTYQTSINLDYKQIGLQGCQYLSQTKWVNLTRIELNWNNIGAQGCKYLSKANWIQLTWIQLNNNNIGAQGCKYLSQANWKHLSTIYLNCNNISFQGCKYLREANWIYLNTINLDKNDIGEQGCKYLSQMNYKHLSKISLQYNNIGAQGCKYLSQANWEYLSIIYLYNNNIGAQGCKYLSQASWIDLKNISLNDNNIMNVVYLVILKQLWRDAYIDN